MDSSITKTAELTEILGLVEKVDASAEDQTRAFELASSRQSVPMVTAILGIFYEFGVGTEVDCPKAESCYLQAAEEDHCPCERALALSRLIDIYWFGAPGCRLSAKREMDLEDELLELLDIPSSSSSLWLLRYYEDEEECAQVEWPLGQYLLARCYMYEWGILASSSLAMNLYTKAAAQGDPFAKAALAILPADVATSNEWQGYRYGLVMDAVKARPNDGRILFALAKVHEQRGEFGDAISAYMKSSASGFPPAWLGMANLYADYDSPCYDLPQAIMCYRLAASMGSDEAMRKLGKLHELGMVNGKVDIDAAIRCYEQLVELDGNEFLSQLHLWRLSAVPPAGNPTESWTRYDEMMYMLPRALAGDHEAECFMGQFYLKFFDFRRLALELANDWLTRAHNGGNLNGTSWLCYLMWEDPTSPFYNLDQARVLAEIVVAGAYPDNRPVTFAFTGPRGTGEYALGEVCRLQGDLVSATYWYAKAIVENRRAELEAILSLLPDITEISSVENKEILKTIKQMTTTLMMEKKRPKDAFPFLMHFAELGDAHCQRQVGKCLLVGVGVKRNPKAGIAWLEKALANGNVQACLDLGTVYHKGVTDLCGPDQVKAREFYEKALLLDPNNPAALFQMGMFLMDMGDSKDEEIEAVRLIKRSADAGYKPAEKHMNWLVKSEQQLSSRFSEYAASLSDA